MKKTLALLAAGLLTGTAFAADDAEQQIRAQFPGSQIDAVRASELPGVYEVTAGKNILYAVPGTKVVLVGHLYDTATGEDLTQPRLDALRALKVDWSALPLQDAIKSGDGPLPVAVFTDPDCPFCRKLEHELPKLQGVTVYRFLFPIPGLHPEAEAHARSIWCAQQPEAALRTLMVEGKPLPKAGAQCQAEAIGRNVALAQRLGISGTPALIRADGQMLMGWRPAEVIEEWLKGGKQ